MAAFADPHRNICPHLYTFPRCGDHNWMTHLEQLPTQNHNCISIHNLIWWHLTAKLEPKRWVEMKKKKKKRSCYTRASLHLKFYLQYQVILSCPFPCTSVVSVTRISVQNSVLSFPYSIQKLCHVWHVIYENTENFNPTGAEKIYALWVHPWIRRSITQTQRELIHFNNWVQFW